MTGISILSAGPRLVFQVIIYPAKPAYHSIFTSIKSSLDPIIHDREITIKDDSDRILLKYLISMKTCTVDDEHKIPARGFCNPHTILYAVFRMRCTAKGCSSSS